MTSNSTPKNIPKRHENNSLYKKKSLYTNVNNSIKYSQGGNNQNAHPLIDKQNMVKVTITQLCLILLDPMDCSLPGSSVHGILQAIMLEWVGIPFSRGIFPTQGSNPCLSALQSLYHVSHQGS